MTYGKGIEEAIEMATDALEGHLLVMEDDGDNISFPSTHKDLYKMIGEDDQLQLISVDTNLV
ncbi:type II toxin-antitoxin system HicB family antitoxin [Staphylococcus caprae]|uniref:type II toxin-antitoxin system HicB family antitoxin n=1 Tax=Staphylococcus caprae TaxID=29380 RepID=UPI003B216057